MARRQGTLAFFSLVDSGGTVRDLSTYLTSIEGLPGPVDQFDTTGLGSWAKTYIAGLKDARVSLRGFFDNVATSGPDVVFTGLHNPNPPVQSAFVYSPEGTGAGTRKFSGNAILADYRLTSPINGPSTFAVELQKSGDLTIATN